MTREQLLEWCRHAPKVGSVAHEEFADYVVALQQRKRGEDGWTTTEHPYMTVDGKLAMANEDHRRQGKMLDFSPPQVLVDSEDALTLMVTVTSEMYGTRHGIATSRRVNGTAAEREFPWEVAETSAIGRALSAMGYGLFPGSGLASAEDMLRVESERRGNTAQERSTERGTERPAQERAPQAERQANERQAQRSGNAYARPQPPISPVQKRKLAELWRSLHGGSDTDAAEALDTMFGENFRHGMNEATYEEAARMTAQLLSELRNRTSQTEC